MTLPKIFVAIVALLLLLAHFSKANPTVVNQNAQCSTDKYRPRYHFSPAANWINDPNGMVYYDGVYHLFYQYHPFSMSWGSMHWGHAVSKNLVTWKELDIALEPDNIGEIFSGSSVVDNLNTAGFKSAENLNDPIVAIFTSATGDEYTVQRQSLAYSLDKGQSFKKYKGNPVLENPDNKDFRDPKVFYHDGRWIMSLAVGNKIEFYSSLDLKSWKKESEFGHNPEQGNHDGVWECPDLIPLSIDINDKLTIEQWVLLVSINPGGPNKGSATQYFIGNFSANNSDSIAFHTNPWKDSQWLDWGPDNYAGVTFSNDPNGRFIYIGWMSNWLYANSTPTSSWRGQLTIPRELSLRLLKHEEKQYRLVSTPIRELEALRNQLQYLDHSREFSLLPQSSAHLTEKADFTTPLMEVEITVEIENQPQFGICARNSVGEEVCFGLNQTSWYLDRSKSGNVGFNREYASTLHATTAPREYEEKEITIRMFLDVSSIEVFADGGVTTMTALHYPSQPLDGIYINHWSSADTDSYVKVKNFKVWGLQCWFTEEASGTGTPEPGDNSGAGATISSTIIIVSILSATMTYLIT